MIRPNAKMPQYSSSMIPIQPDLSMAGFS